MSFLTDKFRRVFEVYRDKTIITESFSGRSVTAGELDVLSGRIASALKEKGVNKGAIIPIVLPRSIEYIAAEIGVLRAGCAYAPLLEEYPQERVDFIKGDCGASFVIDKDFLDTASAFEPMNDYEESGDDDLSLLIYTSGSTGTPKGVIHTHRSFFEAIKKNTCINGMTSNDKTLGIVSFSFALSVAEVYDTILSGAQLLILNDQERKDLTYVRQTIIDRNITALYINPNMLKRLDIHDSSLRFVQTVGERLSGFYTDEYRIINTYGSSETMCSLTFDVDKAYDNTPIGTPADGVCVYLLDENGREVPKGEEGEICLAGVFSRGYWKLDQQTNTAFTSNPFSDDKNLSTLYHTNDTGRMLPDGNIVYINRRD